MHFRRIPTSPSSRYPARLLRLAILLILAAGASSAAPPTADLDLRLDHFRCYPVLQPPDVFFIVPLVLEDQFDQARERRPTVQPGLADRFCNPSTKRIDDPAGRGGDAGILDDDAHLTMYPIHEILTPSPAHLVWRIHIENQFGPQQIYARRPVFIAVPTQKLVPGAHPPPENLDHFKCYEAKGKSVDLQAELHDQFNDPGPFLILDPKLFCNPVEKSIGTGPPLATIENPDAHLTCYDIVTPPGLLGFSTILNLVINNQFTFGVITMSVVTSEDLLCVPTRKVKAFGTPGSLVAP